MESKLKTDHDERTLTIEIGFADVEALAGAEEPPDEAEVRELCHDLESETNCVAFGRLERDIGMATRMIIRAYVPHYAEFDLIRRNLERRVSEFRHNRIATRKDDE